MLLINATLSRIMTELFHLWAVVGLDFDIFELESADWRHTLVRGVEVFWGPAN